MDLGGNEELAESRDDVESSGFSNSAMDEQVTGTTDKLAEDGALSQIIEESMTAGAAAAFITYTINLGVELKTGKKIIFLRVDLSSTFFNLMVSNP